MVATAPETVALAALLSAPIAVGWRDGTKGERFQERRRGDRTPNPDATELAAAFDDSVDRVHKQYNLALKIGQ